MRSQTLILRTGAASLLAAALVVSAVAAERTLEGEVVFRERIALPEGAVVDVQLVDVSLADAPAKVLGETRLGATGSPIPYEITYDDAGVLPGHRYALQARISIDDRLLFINTDHHPALTEGQGNDVLVRMVASAEPAPTPVGAWLTEYIEGAGVIDFEQTTLVIAEDGAVTGSGGCNNYRGQAEIDGEAIRFSPVAATRMACPPASMDQEQRFFAALAKVAGFRADPQMHKLYLLDADGAVMVQLSAN